MSDHSEVTPPRKGRRIPELWLYSMPHPLWVLGTSVEGVLGWQREFCEVPTAAYTEHRKIHRLPCWSILVVKSKHQEDANPSPATCLRNLRAFPLTDKNGQILKRIDSGVGFNTCGGELQACLSSGFLALLLCRAPRFPSGFAPLKVL